MRIVYLGTPRAARAPLEALADRHDVTLVLTGPDRRRRRRGAPEPSPVKQLAIERGLAVASPAGAGELRDAVRASGAEVGVVVAYGRILAEEVLRIPPLGFVNLHLSLLPRWRGAAPVERALLAGDARTGACVMRLDAGLDTGPVYARRSLEIGDRETAGELTGRLVAVGTDLLVETLPVLRTLTPEPQRGESTVAPKLTVGEFALDWARPAVLLDRAVRAANPRPGAWTTLDGARLKVWEAEPVAAVPAPPGVMTADGVVATGEGALALRVVQPEGARRLDAAAWLAGRRERDAVLGT